MNLFLSRTAPLFVALLLLASPLQAEPITIVTQSSYSTNAYAPADPANAQSIDVAALLIWQDPSENSHILKLLASRDVGHAAKTSRIELGDGHYGFTQALWAPSDQLSLTHESRLSFPMSSQSQKNEGLITRLLWAPKLSFSTYHEQLKNWRFVLNPALSKSFHKYETKRSGPVNTSHSLNTTITIEQAPNDQLSFSLSGSVVSSWDYRQTRRPTNYVLEQEISYSFNQTTALALGHSNSDRLYQGPSQDQLDIDPFDPYSSTYYLTFTQLF